MFHFTLFFNFLTNCITYIIYSYLQNFIGPTSQYNVRKFSKFLHSRIHAWRCVTSNQYALPFRHGQDFRASWASNKKRTFLARFHWIYRAHRVPQHGADEQHLFLTVSDPIGMYGAGCHRANTHNPPFSDRKKERRRPSGGRSPHPHPSSHQWLETYDIKTKMCSLTCVCVRVCVRVCECPCVGTTLIQTSIFHPSPFSPPSARGLTDSSAR